MFGSIPPEAMEKVNRDPFVRLQRGIDKVNYEITYLTQEKVENFLKGLGDKAMGALGAFKDLGRKGHDEQMRIANNMRG